MTICGLQELSWGCLPRHLVLLHMGLFVGLLGLLHSMVAGFQTAKAVAKDSLKPSLRSYTESPLPKLLDEIATGQPKFKRNKQTPALSKWVARLLQKSMWDGKYKVAAIFENETNLPQHSTISEWMNEKMNEWSVVTLYSWHLSRSTILCLGFMLSPSSCWITHLCFLISATKILSF